MIQHADLVGDFNKGIDQFLRAIKGETGSIGEAMPTGFRAQLTGREVMHFHLPFLNNPLRGRDEDVKAIQGMLGAHVTQVIGLGGWGKSRISAEITLAYPQGAIWHRCSPVSRSHEVVSLIRKHFDLPDETETDDVLRRLGEYKPLIIIDNAEDVPQQGAVRDGYIVLLKKMNAYGVPVLLTSRIVWEEFKPRKQYPPPAFSPTTAVDVVNDFANRQQITLTTDEAKELAEAARFHPRLIEFAVGQLLETPVQTVIRRLKALKRGEIQDFLDDMIRSTLNSMRQDEEFGIQAFELLHNLTWLQGTFPLEVIDSLKPDTITHEDEFLDALTVLQRYQFVRYNQKERRYALADLLREAIGTPQAPAIFDKYADFYIQRAKEIFVDLLEHQELWVDHEYDFPNIIALGGLLMERTQFGTTGDLARAVRFAVNTADMVNYRRELQLWDWVKMGMNAVECLRQESPNDVQLKSDEAVLLHKWGINHSRLGNNQEAITFYERALALRREIGDKKGESSSLASMAGVISSLGDKQTALAYFEQVLDLRRSIGYKRGEAMTNADIGVIWSGFGDRQKALIHYHLQYDLYVEIDDKHGVANALNNIAFIYSVMGNLDKALAYYQQSLELRHLVRTKSGEALTLSNIGALLRRMGRLDEAQIHLEEALRIRRQIASKGGEAITLNHLGRLWLDRQDSDMAQKHCQQALEIVKEIGNKRRIGEVLNNLGRIAFARQDYPQAIAILEEAISFHQYVKAAWSEADAHYLIGQAYEAQGEKEKAIVAIQKAFDTTNDQDPDRSIYLEHLQRLQAQ
jgi:tetratricopeptide (TPR) repeat protein